MKNAVIFTLGVLVGLFGAFIMRNEELGPLEIPDGHYQIYHMHNAYDTETGEPIYWLIANLVKMQGGMPIHKNKIRLFRISRQTISNLFPLKPPDRGMRLSSFLLKVSDGKAEISDAHWIKLKPPVVVTK